MRAITYEKYNFWDIFEVQIVGKEIKNQPLQLTFLFSDALNLWVSKMIWRAIALLLVIGALAQGIDPADVGRRLAIWGVGNPANVDTRAILAALLFLAILISSTAWQAFATLAYFSPSLAITVAFAPRLF